MCDTSFYGKRKDYLSTVALYDSRGVRYSINEVALDGMRGLNRVLEAGTNTNNVK